MFNLVKLKESNEFKFENINDFLLPKHIYIPYENNSIHKNDYLYKNTNIGSFTTSVSGTINNLKKVLIDGKIKMAIEINNDFKENSTNKIRKRKTNNKQELLNILELFNLNNIKEKIDNILNIKNLVITSIDEENTSVKEFFYLTYYYQEILDTISNLMQILNLNKSFLATKSTNLNSIKNVKSIIGTYPNIMVNLVPNKYLISQSKFICEYLNIFEKDTLVLTTSEIYYIYMALNYRYINETLISISGDAIIKSLVVNVKLYSSLQEILNEFFEITDEDYDIYLNGYLGGIKLSKKEKIIITLDTHSFVIKKKEEIKRTTCINCGACYKICPMRINVKNYYFNSKNHPKCYNCGLCNYICPAKLPLKEVVGGLHEKL